MISKYPNFSLYNYYSLGTFFARPRYYSFG